MNGFSENMMIRNIHSLIFKYAFKLIFKIPKFMDTSLIDANIFPDYVSVRVKDKLTQIRLGEEVIVNQSSL